MESSLLNIPNEVLLLIDTKGNIKEINDLGASLLKSNQSDLIGQNLWKLLPDVTSENRKTIVNKVIKSNKMVRFQSDDFESSYDVTVFPITNEKSEIIEVGISSREIVQKKIKKYRETRTCNLNG